jgi:hypothetical protein
VVVVNIVATGTPAMLMASVALRVSRCVAARITPTRWQPLALALLRSQELDLVGRESDTVRSNRWPHIYRE